MKAVVYEGSLRIRSDYPNPLRRPGWAILRVRQAGICQTDIEITRGYMGFRGVLGHEFVATVVEADDAAWIGQRVVGEINVGCGDCPDCRRGDARHCPARSTLGILGLDGCMAEYSTLPLRNLRVVPEALSDDEAVFVEPLAAAYEILEQVHVSEDQRWVVLGDGRLGILCAWVLSTISQDVTLVGHHPHKLERAQWGNLKIRGTLPEDRADYVVDATGAPEGLPQALSLCRPRGTVVLKTTVARQYSIDLAPVVIHEKTILGSRCGRFDRALEGMRQNRFPVRRLISARYPLDQAIDAFSHAERADAIKVLVRVHGND